LERTLFFADGENLVFRYQAMVAAGRVPLSGNSHVPDILIWRHDLFRAEPWQTLRATYYTSVVGDEALVTQTRRHLQNIYFSSDGPVMLHAAVFKKERKSLKSRAVDVNITIDALHHCYGGHADRFCFATGDADFLPLIQTLMREGKEVFVCAFSDGLAPALQLAPDRFVSLDDSFFAPSPAAA
jgi:uncharacterized LabA/DUF88 family protein